MALCGTCGAQTARIRQTFTAGGKPLATPKDECPNCAPQSFEKHTDPSDLRLWTGPQVDPAHYKRTEDGYQASDSVLQDLEDWATREEEDTERNERFLAQRRAYCAARRKPETPAEKADNDAKARAFIRQQDAEAYLEQSGFVLPEMIQ
jgi:ribosomal protein S27AE